MTNPGVVLLPEVVIQVAQRSSGCRVCAYLYKLDAKLSVGNFMSVQALSRGDDDSGEIIIVG